MLTPAMHPSVHRTLTCATSRACRLRGRLAPCAQSQAAAVGVLDKKHGAPAKKVLVRKAGKHKKPKSGDAAGNAVDDAPQRLQSVTLLDDADMDIEHMTQQDGGPDSDSAALGALPLSANLGRFRALVLDSGYRPINVVSWFKAVMMEELGKVDVLTYYDNTYAYSAYRRHPLPAVVRVGLYVNMHELAGKVTLTRRNIMVRDQWCCQYCSSRRDLTIDHVTPISKGGINSWQNLVTACMSCNQRKGHQTLKQLGWRLKVEPREPSPMDVGIVLGVSPGDVERAPPEWYDYIQPFKDKIENNRRTRAPLLEH